MTDMVARVAAMAALLVGSAALPAAAMADARVNQSVEADAADASDDTGIPDWALLATACVTLVVGRTIVSRRVKTRTEASPIAPNEIR